MLLLELDGFEGPLDLLLVLARNQKVDLAKISILELAEQYLAYIDAARELRLEIAADYLVMASWLAYLKSKLLLPEREQAQDGPTGQELAAQLAFRLKRLEAMREALASMMGRKRLGIDLFSRGMPEGIRVIRSTVFQASIFDLLKAYAEQRQKNAVTEVKWGGRVVWSIKQARDRLTSLLGAEPDWTVLDKFLEEYKPSPVLGLHRHGLKLRRYARTRPRRLHRIAPDPAFRPPLSEVAEQQGAGRKRGLNHQGFVCMEAALRGQG